MPQILLHFKATLQYYQTQLYRLKTKLDNHKPGMVAHACNSIFSRGGNQKDQGSRLAQAKSKQDSISTQKSPVILATQKPK
jgi:hypothetical protein